MSKNSSKPLEIWLADVYFKMHKSTDSICVKNVICCKVSLLSLQKDIVFVNRALKAYSTLVSGLKLLETDPETGYKKIAKVEFKKKLSESNLNYEQYCRERNIG